MTSLLFALTLILATPASAQPRIAIVAAQPRIAIVAAENFYGDIAGQIAGPEAEVTSILSNPDQDPHLFEASPSVARALAGAKLVVSNGVEYDPWMARLLRASRAPSRQVVVAGEVLKLKPGVNPHLWYDPANMKAVAGAIAAALGRIDPEHATGFAARLATFEASLAPIEARIAQLRQRLQGRAVGATEPVFGLMAARLGLVMRHERFQIAIMNGTEPRLSDVAAFEADLRGKHLAALFTNSQATGPAAQRLVALAHSSGVPTIGVTETAPASTTYQGWMMKQLDAVDAALP